MSRKLKVWINPSWTISSYVDITDLPEGWDLWTEETQVAYVNEIIATQVEDSGYDVIEVDE